MLQTRKRRLLFFLFLISPLLGPAARCFADKVIMKDGKIYQGRIMGETQDSVLISNAPYDPKPRFIEIKDVLTIVRESGKDPHSIESDRYAVVEALLSGQVFSSNTLTLNPAAGLHVGGGFRLHPLVEIGAIVDWVPDMSGQVAITDGTNLRGYEHFYSYGGGFTVKFFPL
jgi:hypothetical protein